MATSQLQNALSDEKSTSGFKVALHPLVILTISDYLTRHTLRNQPGPLIGALLGQQNESHVSIEHAFEINALTGQVDVPWFMSRLEDMKAVHKSPPLDFVGIYTSVPTTGPTSYHSQLAAQFSALVPDTTVLLLGFHSEAALQHSTSGSLPVTIYELCTDASHKIVASDGDVEMSDANAQDNNIHFHPLNYTIESGEAERIAVDFVARGTGNAQAVSSSTSAKFKPAQGGEPMISTKKRTKEQQKNDVLPILGGKGKGKEAEGEHKAEKTPEDVNALLSADEQEMIESLTAKANAVRMLQSRIELMQKHIAEFESPTSSNEERNPEILRSISALLARLPLVVPSSTDANGETTTDAWDKEVQEVRSDVELVSLLAKMTESLAETREMGKRFQAFSGLKKGKSEGGAGGEAYEGFGKSSRAGLAAFMG